MPSQAYARFRRAVREDIDPLLAMHREATSAPGRPGFWRVSIRRSAVVLLSAALEACAEGVVVEALAAMADAQTPAEYYPDGLRGYVLLREVKRIQAHMGLPEAEALGDLRDKWNSTEWKPARVDLPLAAIEQEFDNPTPAAVNWLMAVLDYEDYVAWQQIQVNGTVVNSTSKLEELVRRRNGIAHGDPQTPSIETVKTLRSFALSLARRIDRDARSVAGEASGTNPWDP